MRFHISVLIATGFVLLSAPAQADTVALSWLEVTGDASDRFAEQVEDTVIAKLRDLNIDAMSYTGVKSAADGIKLGACTTPSCLNRLSKLIDADRFLRLDVETSGASYTFTLQLLSKKAEMLKRQEEMCPVCTVTEARDKLAEMVEQVMNTPTLVNVEIKTQPEGATLTLKGEALGEAPYQGTMKPGTYKVTASKDGYEDAELTIELPENSKQAQNFTITLTRPGGGSASTDVDTGDTPGRPFRVVKYAGLVTALGAIGAGLTWLAIDGTDGPCDASSFDCDNVPDGPAPFAYDTQQQGLIALGAGVGLAAVTAFMFWHDARATRKERAVKAGLSPTRGGAMATVRLEF